MRNFKLLVIATIALLQIQQAYSFYNFFQGNSAPAQPAQPEGASHLEVSDTGFQQQETHPHHQHHHHHGGQMQGQGQGGFGMGILMQAKQFMKPLQTWGAGAIAGLHKNPQMAQMMRNPFVHQYIHGKQSFYNECGTTVRHCEWMQRQAQPVRGQAAAAQQQIQADEIASNAKPEMEHSCFTISKVCVGNTEKCISNRTCDVAMKISEMTIEKNGEVKATGISSISHLNNCHMEGQSVTDSSRMPQMLFGIGFATYDAAGQKLECRKPKASDFKLVFLWKNSTVDEENKENGHCKPKPPHHPAVHPYDNDIMNTVRSWPTICKSMEKKEESFNMKTFLANHVPTLKYTPFFSPPFSFADNYEPTYSSNGMVISGVVSA